MCQDSGEAETRETGPQHRSATVGTSRYIVRDVSDSPVKYQK